jgi:serine/threonine-protein kinase
MPSLPCPSCGAENSEFNARCAACGEVLPADTVDLGATRPDLAATAVTSPASAARVPPAGLARGEPFGRFLILDRLGEGGMGVVVSAHDPALDRRVAIKVLHAERQAARDRARLLREARAMAKLSHPNVVTVYEVGVDGEQVFVAMEYVAGKTLRAWLDEQPRAWREIVEKYRLAGRGLAAAHRAGLVHRDFKPDNVLIGDDGRVRVTDFGIAGWADAASPTTGPSTAAGPEAAARPPALTITGTLLGTPSYMAPEQHQRRQVDGRADQFAFCVALYEALHGERPFGGSSYEELAANVLAGRIREAPAGAPAPAWIRAILLRGLETEPADRYPDLDALLAELEKDPAVTRRRAAAAAALAAAIVLAIVGLARRPKVGELCQGADRRLAGVWDERAKGAARAAMLATGRPYAEDTFRRVDVILEGRARAWVAMYVESCEATNVRGDQSAQLLDLRTWCLDRRREEMKALTELLAKGPDGDVLDNSVQASLALTGLGGCADASALAAAIPPPPDAEARARIDALRARAGEAKALDDAGKYQDGLALASPLAGDARATRYAPIEAEALAMLGRLQRDMQDAKAAEGTLREAALAAARAKDDARLAEVWTELIYVVGVQQARFADALALRPVAETAVARAGGGPSDGARLLSTLGAVLNGQGSYAEAVACDQQALATFEKILGPEHLTVATLLADLGQVLNNQDRLDEARKVGERSLAIREKVLGPAHPEVGMALNNLGNLLNHHGKYEESRPYVERALDIFEKALGPDHPNTALALGTLGKVFTNLARYDEAWRCHERALAIQEKAFGPDHPLVGTSLYCLGVLLDNQERPREAEGYYRRALAVQERALGPDHRSVAQSLRELGGVLLAQKKYDEALPYLERAVGINERAVGPASIAVAISLNKVANCHLHAGRPERAVAPMERALSIQSAPGAVVNGDALAETRFFAARALGESGRDRRRAAALIVEARAWYAAEGAIAKVELDEVEAWMKKQGIQSR